ERRDHWNCLSADQTRWPSGRFVAVRDAAADGRHSRPHAYTLQLVCRTSRNHAYFRQLGAFVYWRTCYTLVGSTVPLSTRSLIVTKLLKLTVLGLLFVGTLAFDASAQTAKNKTKKKSTAPLLDASSPSLLTDPLVPADLLAKLKLSATQKPE